jgi:uncharacterized protein (TIGR02145 family)
MKNLKTHKIIKKICSLFLLTLFGGCERVSIPEVDFTGQTGTITDIDDNTYITVGIGTQIWMAENLRTTKLNEGTIIPEVTKDTNWIYLDTPGLCWYNNDSARYNNSYGTLYNYNTVNTGMICPESWHVPTESDWKTLVRYLGGDKIAGGKLKHLEGNFWNSPNPSIVNNYGFNALPGGYRRHSYINIFMDIRNRGYWWTSTPTNNFLALTRSMSYNDKTISRFEQDRKDGCSIRCVKD